MLNNAVKRFISDQPIDNQLNFDAWYHPETCHYLLQMTDNTAKCIRVNFNDSSHGDNTKTFKDPGLSH